MVGAQKALNTRCVSRLRVGQVHGVLALAELAEADGPLTAQPVLEVGYL